MGYVACRNEKTDREEPQKVRIMIFILENLNRLYVLKRLSFVVGDIFLSCYFCV